METREALTSRWRSVLYFTAVAITVTFLIAIWTICKDVVQQWIHPTVEDVMDGIYVNGIRFVSLSASNEFVLTITNILTDLLLVVIAYKTVTALHRPISAASLVFIMVATTILIALARLVLNAITKHITFYSAHATIPLELLAELETFCAAIVSCIPGLRVLVRSWNEEVVVGRDVVVGVDMTKGGSRFLDPPVMGGAKCGSSGSGGSCAAMATRQVGIV
ncbi:hypothetical protein K440DRAFT_611841 [Wilcoxina mikolae CBS 423.85]|nr:hypothetical protein K440DRAFT_611841 [Wilcoxina mikolae CBS 423.85]